MDDFFVRFGMIIVGIVVFSILLAFGNNALNKSVVIEDKFQKYEGSGKTAASYLTKLCKSCLSQKEYNRDCYVVDFKGSVSKDLFDDNIILSSLLPDGSYILKLKDYDKRCIIAEVGDAIPDVSSCNIASCNELDDVFYDGFRQKCCDEHSVCC